MDEARQLTFGSPIDRMSTRKDGLVVMHRFQRVLLDGVVIGNVELHLDRLGKTPTDFGAIAVVRVNPSVGGRR